MTNPITLTISAILLTLFGDAPIETWFPLIKDIAVNVGTMMLNVLGVG